jgi:hypothetical protein
MIASLHGDATMNKELRKFKKLPPSEKVTAIAVALKEQAKQCLGNFLLEGTWIDYTLHGAAERLMEVAHELQLKEMREMMGKPAKYRPKR